MRMRALGPVVLVGSLVALLLAASATPSLAWWRGGVWIGPGVVVGPPVVVVPPPVYVQPPVVVEQPAPVYQEQSPQAAQQFWYYCQDPAGYYPYVKECPRGWQPVSPTPK